jgi:hypothetical protein
VQVPTTPPPTPPTTTPLASAQRHPSPFTQMPLMPMLLLLRRWAERGRQSVKLQPHPTTSFTNPHTLTPPHTCTQPPAECHCLPPRRAHLHPPRLQCGRHAAAADRAARQAEVAGAWNNSSIDCVCSTWTTHSAQHSKLMTIVKACVCTTQLTPSPAQHSQAADTPVLIFADINNNVQKVCQHVQPPEVGGYLRADAAAGGGWVSEG